MESASAVKNPQYNPESDPIGVCLDNQYLDTNVFPTIQHEAFNIDIY